MSTMSSTFSTPASASAAEEPSTTASFSGEVCALCCEENVSASSPTSSTVILSTCHHVSCKACLVKWIEREELSGQTTPPSCPFCRCEICSEDVVAIAGRPFQPRRANLNNTVAHNPNNDDDGDDIGDDLTLQWIIEHTVPCGGCGSPIEKAGGCDLVECLCGYRFCYGCGIPGGECTCEPTHMFDNDRYERNDAYVPPVLIRDGDGRVDLRLSICRREVRRVREVEEEGRRFEVEDRWEYSERSAGICTSNGRWLFVPKKNTGSISMLTQQLRSCDVRVMRECDDYELEWEDWVRWESSLHNAALCKRRRWLFAPRYTRRNSHLNHPGHESWLFLPRGEDAVALKQYARGKRYRKKLNIGKFVRGMYDAVRKRTDEKRRSNRW
mmetsp:Transcript_34603/g.74806  ORF Transcript_34603/g.74806 Transcript_34603/m.74806 type:complete len:384 (-) Transcript_34603:208-1359(-)